MSVKSLSFENMLYVLSMILSLAFVSLIILSLATTPLDYGQPPRLLLFNTLNSRASAWPSKSPARSVPQFLRRDNGPGFIAQALLWHEHFPATMAPFRSGTALRPRKAQKWQLP